MIEWYGLRHLPRSAEANAAFFAFRRENIRFGKSAVIDVGWGRAKNCLRGTASAAGQDVGWAL